MTERCHQPECDCCKVADEQSRRIVVIEATLAELTDKSSDFNALVDDEMLKIWNGLATKADRLRVRKLAVERVFDNGFLAPNEKQTEENRE